MKKKVFILGAGVIMLCFSFGLFFTLSSFDKNDPDPGPDICDTTNITRQISINFPNPNEANQYRNPNFQGWIPSEDLRSYTTPGVLPSVKDKWYSKVTITSSQCTDFLYEWVLEEGNHLVNIELPGEADFYVQIDYYETFDSPYNPFDFNIDVDGPNCLGSHGYVTWHANEYFMSSWNNGITQPIYLTLGVLGCEYDGFGIDIGKGLMPEDYETANDFIEDRNDNN